MPPLTHDRPGVDRRAAFKLLTGALAAAALTRCSPPDEEVIPYVDMPEGLVPGEPMRFATTLPLSGYGRGFLAISVDGRPIKIEGNPRHPFSLGATDVFAEAEVLSLYDTNRSSVPRRGEQLATWDDFIADWGHFSAASANAQVALVTGRVLSPAGLAGIEALRKRFPELRWYRYEPVNDDAARVGARLAFGKMVSVLPRWADADVVLTLAADPLGHSADELRTARGFASRRGPEHRQRLHAVEPAWTLTGAAADFRLALPPELVGEVARLVARNLGAELGEPALPDQARAFAERVGRELAAAPGRAFMIVGEGQSPELHALCHWINGRLEAPIDYVASPDPVEEDHAAALAALAEDLHAHRIGALIVADANPVYDAPDRMHLADAVKAVPFSMHLGLHRDETAQCCHWHLPLSHPLESWGDMRALDGTASLVQPLIRPLYDTRTRDELIAMLAEAPAKAHDLVRQAWRTQADGDFERWWRTALHDGVIANSAAAPVNVTASTPAALPAPEARSELTLVLAPDTAVWDGRFAANAWLQECPRPFTKQVWGNAVQMAPGDADRLGVAVEDTVDLTIDGQSLTLPAIIMAGQAEGVVATSWGQGRRDIKATDGIGVGQRCFGFGLRPFSRVLTGAQVRKSVSSIPFHSTQHHTDLQGRAEELFKIATLPETGEAKREDKPVPNLLGIPSRGEYAWAMVVDTDRCIGCNACVIACQAENNVPVVGPEEVSLGRDMHWLRVDTYMMRPEAGTTRRGFQPVPCMHCELAPCEPVCPVEASVHDRQGLNVQVYNRCIGTRFCEANCPYKVRRFNWFAYADGQAYGDLQPALKAQHNPDVSARGRGVMEKCNYCLQRISRARQDADKEDRRIAEGEVVTACQAACPTRAIHFGDLNRADSEVPRLRNTPEHYVLLEKLNTRPRTTYLKRLYSNDEPR